MPPAAKQMMADSGVLLAAFIVRGRLGDLDELANVIERQIGIELIFKRVGRRGKRLVVIEVQRPT